MTTSGDYGIALRRDQIIKKALQIVGALPDGQEPTLIQQQDGALNLNLLIQSYLSEGLLDWHRDTFVLFLEANRAIYTRPMASSAKPARWALDTTLLTGTLASAYTAGDSTITLNAPPSSSFSNTTIAVGFNVGVRGVDGVLQWTVLAALVDDQPSTLTLATTLDTDCEVGAKVYLYPGTSDDLLPERIITVTRRGESDNDIPLNPLSLVDYQSLPRKAQQGTPLQYTSQSTPDGLRLFLWPIPRNDNYRLYIVATTQFRTLDAGDDTAPIPTEWYLPLVWELAATLAVEYGLDTRLCSVINARAVMYKDKALSYAMEGSYLKLEPDRRY